MWGSCSMRSDSFFVCLIRLRKIGKKVSYNSGSFAVFKGFSWCSEAQLPTGRFYNADASVSCKKLFCLFFININIFYSELFWSCISSAVKSSIVKALDSLLLSFVCFNYKTLWLKWFAKSVIETSVVLWSLGILSIFDVAYSRGRSNPPYGR